MFCLGPMFNLLKLPSNSAWDPGVSSSFLEPAGGLYGLDKVLHQQCTPSSFLASTHSCKSCLVF